MPHAQVQTCNALGVGDDHVAGVLTTSASSIICLVSHGKHMRTHRMPCPIALYGPAYANKDMLTPAPEFSDILLGCSWYLVLSAGVMRARCLSSCKGQGTLDHLLVLITKVYSTCYPGVQTAASCVRTGVTSIDSSMFCTALAVRAACCCGSCLLASRVSGRSLAKSASSTGKLQSWDRWLRSCRCKPARCSQSCRLDARAQELAVIAGTRTSELRHCVTAGQQAE